MERTRMFPRRFGAFAHKHQCRGTLIGEVAEQASGQNPRCRREAAQIHHFQHMVCDMNKYSN